MKIIAIISIVLIAGCDVNQYSPHNAMETHVCTVSEFTRVKAEATYCAENTGYLGAHCLGTAIVRICSLNVRFHPLPPARELNHE
tara:strand:- start:4418 stop:4672 length:255 start_codon:yes stop_codon:yes gene_type:complete